MSASIAVPGGQNLDWGVTPLRQYPPGTVRAVDQKNPPVIVSATGLGNGGAFIINQGADADASQGLIACRIGLGFASTGTVVIQWPVAPPAAAGGFVFLCDWATLVPSGTNPITLTWTQLPSEILVPGQRKLIAYQWRNPV